jgi:hypothetical protein
MKCFDRFIVLLDRSDGFDFGNGAEIVHYSPSDNYSRRMSGMLESIDDEYILMMHDVDLPININRSKIAPMMSLFLDNRMDRLSLGVFNTKQKEDVVCGEDICTARLRPGMSANFYTPFDHSPSIWRRDSLLRLYNTFREESYFSIEQNGDAQSWVDREFKCYGLQKTMNTDIVYHRGFAYSKDFSFLHITIQGKFMSRETYFDLLPEFDRIVADYSISLPTKDTRFVSKNEID